MAPDLRVKAPKLVSPKGQLWCLWKAVYLPHIPSVLTSWRLTHSNEFKTDSKIILNFHLASHGNEKYKVLCLARKWFFFLLLLHSCPHHLPTSWLHVYSNSPRMGGSLSAQVAPVPRLCILLYSRDPWSPGLQAAAWMVLALHLLFLTWHTCKEQIATGLSPTVESMHRSCLKQSN